MRLGLCVCVRVSRFSGESYASAVGVGVGEQVFACIVCVCMYVHIIQILPCAFGVSGWQNACI